MPPLLLSLQAYILALLYPENSQLVIQAKWAANSPQDASSFLQSTLPEALYVGISEDSIFTFSDIAQLLPGQQIQLILIKQETPISDSVALPHQLHVVNLAGHPNTQDSDIKYTSYDLVKSLVSHALIPYFDFVAQREATDIVNPAAVLSTKKKLSDLDLSLRHLQHNITVPDLLASIPASLRDVLLDSAPVENLDTALLNTLTKLVNTWIRQIQAVTGLSRESYEQTSMRDEIHFWAMLEAALQSLQNQTAHHQVKRAIEILNAAKRFQTTLAFRNNLNLTERLGETQIYNSLLRDLPIANLSSSIEDSADLSLFSITVRLVFDHFKRWQTQNTFPVQQQISLVELLVREISGSLSAHLTRVNLVIMPYPSFKSICEGELAAIFEAVDEDLKDITNILRELVRKHQGKFIAVKIDLPQFQLLQDQVSLVSDVRLKHEKLLHVSGLFEDSGPQYEALELSYSILFTSSNPFDLSKQSQFSWRLNYRSYSLQYLKFLNFVSNSINNAFRECSSFIEHYFLLRNMIGSSKATNFEFISTFLQEKEKLKLLDLANTDISNLFSYHDSLVHDLQPSNKLEAEAFRLEWEISLQSKVASYRQTIKSILGQNWQKYSIGSQIEELIQVRIKQKDVNQMLAEWSQEALLCTEALERLGNLIEIAKDSLGASTMSVAMHNITALSRLISLGSIIENLGFDLLANVLSRIAKAQILHPIATSLEEHRQLLEHVIRECSMPGTEIPYGFLFEQQFHSLAQDFRSVMAISWAELWLDTTTMKSASGPQQRLHLQKISSFEENVSRLHVQFNAMHRFHKLLKDRYFPQLKRSTYSHESFASTISDISVEVVSLSRLGFCDLQALATSVNINIAHILAARCKKEFENALQLLSAVRNQGVKDSYPYISHALFYENDTFFISPPFDESRKEWYGWVSAILQTVSCQNAIRLNNNHAEEIETSSDVLSAAVLDICTALEHNSSQANAYFQQWLSIQKLFAYENDLDYFIPWSNLYADIDQWLGFVLEFGTSQKLFNSNKGVKSINGYCEVQLLTAVAKVEPRFLSFKTRLFSHFSAQLHRLNSLVVKDIKAWISELSVRIDWLVHNTKLLAFTSKLCEARDHIEEWKLYKSSALKCQRTLHTERIKLNDSWVFPEYLEGLILNVSSLVQDISNAATQQRVPLSLLCKSEWAKYRSETADFVVEWSDQKPIHADASPLSALRTILQYQKRLSLLEKEGISLKSCADFFEVQLESVDFAGAAEEIEELQHVWATLQGFWDDLEEIMRQKWSLTEFEDLKSSMQLLLSGLKSCHFAVRKFSAFDKLQSRIRGILNSFNLLADLKGEHIMDRHWKQIFGFIGVKVARPEQISVGDVLDINLDLYGTALRDIIKQAHQEGILTDNLNSISQEWEVTVFETVDYNGNYRLVKNWKSLFELCDSHLGTLASMRASATLNHLDKEIDNLEQRLSNFLGLLEIWLEVQRQWVYLDGIFRANDEIQVSLPLESSRFSNITLEFRALLKKISIEPIAIQVLEIKGIVPILEKLLGSINLTIKGLTEYLDKQRDLFPRFFFVGDQDLLDLMGCKRQPERVNKHLMHMFPGIQALQFSNDGLALSGFTSSQGESITLLNSISLTSVPDMTQVMCLFEKEMRLTVSHIICEAVENMKNLLTSTSGDLQEMFLLSLRETPCQALLVAMQVCFTEGIADCILNGNFEAFIQSESLLLAALTSETSKIADYSYLSKVRALITEKIYHFDLLNAMQSLSKSKQLSLWNTHQQFYFAPTRQDPLHRIFVKQGHFEFAYGFEYQNVIDRLAITPLVSECFYAMALAVASKLGGSPFGPAGTGKTESVKSFGQNLGRVVIVFCCDDSFDYQSMGRLLKGICKAGCWGCFDEFNRLDPKILSALSSQIEHIEAGLKDPEPVEVSGSLVEVNQNTGIFITMNPSYAGRHKLPETLKKHFRAFSMSSPEKTIITDVLLRSHGFQYSKSISDSLIPLFSDLELKLSSQSHYDFGLRALKSIISKSGSLRTSLVDSNVGDISRAVEFSIILRALTETLFPGLIKDDLVISKQIIETSPFDFGEQLDNATAIAAIDDFAASHNFEVTREITEKVMQIIDIQKSHHGFMIIGDTGSGKSSALNMALFALEKIHTKSTSKYVMDCKVLSKEHLFGSMDSITRDWTDGLITRIIREILTDLKGELQKIVWIVFDGDIDPEWAENLNSLLDDNKILTLPNGERLGLPPNVRFVFEVDNLRSATPATVSRCGKIWFDSKIVGEGMIWRHQIAEAKRDFLRQLDDTDYRVKAQKTRIAEVVYTTATAFVTESLLGEMLRAASALPHIMEYDRMRAIAGIVTFFKIQVEKALASEKIDLFPENLSPFVSKAIYLSCVWALSGDSAVEQRAILQESLLQLSPFAEQEFPKDVWQFDISLPDFEWTNWSREIQHADLEPFQVLDASTIVPTVDTAIHESLVHEIINKHTSLVLCGPPGSGKTMTLLNALRLSAELDVIILNFSKDTTPAQLLKSIEQHCDYKNTSSGTILAPKVDGKWVVVFCDEINLPAVDKYGSQRVVSFMRQLIENSGFWRPRDLQWVTLQNIQFVGACNDPNDPGRNKLAKRFMRHVALVFVDYPQSLALHQIYESFNSAALKCVPELRNFTKELTSAMIDVYQQVRLVFPITKQSHYICSPRELTRWSRGMLKTMLSASISSLEQLLRLWYHEGLRLFHDRLVSPEERVSCKAVIKNIAELHFPHVNLEKVTQDPVFFSNWLSGRYEATSRAELVTFVTERLRVFSEEEFCAELVLFDDMLDHALRIDRVLRQTQGHMILVGPSSSGKTTLVRFVSWINGIKVCQLCVHSGFTLADFEASLRELLLLCAKGEEICYLIDESSILETSFIERINSLLANSEVPGLFEGEDLENLLSVCGSETTSHGIVFDSEKELLHWFRQQVSEKLHVVFTMNDLQSHKAPQVISSPALFNRCVLNWMGDWSEESLTEIASVAISQVPLDQSDFASGDQSRKFRDAVLEALIFVHASCSLVGKKFAPNQFIRFLRTFNDLFSVKQGELEAHQRVTNVGLDKLKETAWDVSEMRKVLSKKKADLKTKDEEARQMLGKMIFDQNEAERKREFSVDAKAELEKHEIEIDRRRDLLMQDLELAEPAVLEAQRGVQNIKKQHLTEMRSMSNPPAAVKMAMESVCILLGYVANSWRDVQLIVRKDDFIASIVNFDNESQLTAEKRAYMEETYLSRPDFNYEAIYRASKACGPLFQWVVAQVRYSEILDKVGPLKEELEHLENYATNSRAKLIALAQMIEELEMSIENYKTQYSEVIRQAERIKVEMEDIEKKVDRSVKLIDNLKAERVSWQESTKKFQAASLRLAGDAILGAGFVAYCGALHQNQREALLSSWKEKLLLLAIRFDELLSIESYLANSTEIQSWKSFGLSEDAIFKENFAIRLWSSVVLIMDPTSQMPEVIRKSLLPTKLVMSSFLSTSFVKSVEDALKFGGTILVENAEHYDPILDSLIRGDFLRSGRRTNVSLGARQVSVLENFKLILYTNDSRFEASEFLRSRVAHLNFSVTSESLKEQTLGVAFRKFEPDLEKTVIEMKSVRSRYNHRLLHLREELLVTLNEVKGTILESDSVLESLESLQTESADIDRRISESNAIMALSNDFFQRFAPLSKQVKLIHSILTQVSELSAFYNFSIDALLQAFEKALQAATESAGPAELIILFYAEVFDTFSPALQEVDRLCLALLFLISMNEEGSMRDVVLQILKLSPQTMTDEQKKKLLSFCRDTTDLSLENWDFFASQNQDVEDFEILSKPLRYFLGAGVQVSKYKALTLLSSDCFQIASITVGALGHLDDRSHPIWLLSTSEGYDVTYEVKKQAMKSNASLFEVSMGTKEGVAAARSALDNVESGRWLLIQNVQMAPDWLLELESMIENWARNEDLKLILTCSLDAASIPNRLIDLCKVVTIEAPPSWKDVLLETFNAVASGTQSSLELHAFFIMSWYHATIVERLKYCPLSFHEEIDINESDAMAAKFVIEKILHERTTQFGADHSDAFWVEVAHCVGQIIYGGKTANINDSKYCSDLAAQLFYSKNQDQDFNLVKNEFTELAGIHQSPPSALTAADYAAWINKLPEVVPLEWLGLPSEIANNFSESEAAQVSEKVLEIWEAI